MLDGGMLEVNVNFYEKYNPQIRAIVARILNNAGQGQDIDDCVNNIFLGLMEKLEKYNESRGSLAAFVAVVARSAALDYCRGNTRKVNELIGDDKLDFFSKPIEIENQVEFKIIIENILEKLNEREKLLFTFKYILYYSHEEIAGIFNINRNAVDARLNRLKNKVRKLLIKGGLIL